LDAGIAGALGAGTFPVGVSHNTTLLALRALLFLLPLTKATSAVTVTACAQAKALQIVSTHTQ
jgi:hypothetical protein